MADYHVSKLTTAAECDKALSLAVSRKSDLVFEQTVSGRELHVLERSSDIDAANLISVNAQITGTQAAIDGMPDGDAKEAMVSRLRRLNDRKDNLEDRLKGGGKAIVLDRELEKALIEAQLAEVDAYITAIAARKGEL